MKKKNSGNKRSLSGVIRAVIVGIASFLLLFLLILTGITPDQYDIHVGEPSTKTVYASKDVEDTVTTEALRQAAANAVEPSFKSVDTSVNGAVLTDLQRMLDNLSGLRKSYTIASRDSISDEFLERANRISPVDLTKEMLAELLLIDEETLNTARETCISEVRDTLNSTLPEGQENAAVTRITRELLSEDYPTPLVSALSEVLRACIKPNMLIDTEITEANREKARQAVNPEMLVKREVIVREGEIVTEAQYQMISNLGLLADNKIDVPLVAGLTLIMLMVCGTIVLYLYMFRMNILMDSKRFVLLWIIIVLQVCLSLLVRGLNSYLMPVALGSILIATLIDSKTALFVNCVLSFMTSMLVSADGLFSMAMFSIMLMALVSGPVAAIILSRKQLRSSTLLAGFAIAATNLVVTMGVGFVSSSNLHTALRNSVWAMGSGIFSAVLAIGLQSLLEWLFNLATNAKLIELSNPNQPLLRRLLLEASGTYHHSIIVANLAEAGASAVGANGLLARVGAYYHDVGKLKRPMYFKENQMGDNPHDRTDPRVSAAILTAHPRDGMQMAQKERLPQPILDIIHQHHGDSACLYFYDKAVKLYGEDVDVSAFRYEGPRPRSKEAAVVMLADTIEAATRTLNNPNPETMEALIRKLVREKLNDGQLNDCALTFGDLDKICSSFVTVLTGVFHERIEYPDIAMPPRTPVIEEVKTEEPAAEEAPAEKTNPEETNIIEETTPEVSENAD